jgi:diguanylate cyclase (GGDEF)-like protein
VLVERVEIVETASEDRLATPLMSTVPPELLASCATLTILCGPEPGRAHEVPALRALLGRDLECDVSIDDPGVSRRHAVIRRVDATFSIEDLQSKNGLFVNGRRTTSAMLRSGDRVHLGANVALRFDETDDLEYQLRRRLFESSTFDALTGALNRGNFFRRLEEDLVVARTTRAEVSLLMLDVDHFKEVNHHHGHTIGDSVLRDLALCISRSSRANDVLGRYGGEEFVVASRATSAADAFRFAERLRAQIETASMAVPITVSIGVASSSELGAAVTPEALVRLADQRLYAAKRLGRNAVVGVSR